jgi:hypothetical protein
MSIFDRGILWRRFSAFFPLVLRTLSFRAKSWYRLNNSESYTTVCLSVGRAECTPQMNNTTLPCTLCSHWIRSSRTTFLEERQWPFTEVSLLMMFSLFLWKTPSFNKYRPGLASRLKLFRYDTIYYLAICDVDKLLTLDMMSCRQRTVIFTSNAWFSEHESCRRKAPHRPQPKHPLSHQ